MEISVDSVLRFDTKVRDYCGFAPTNTIKEGTDMKDSLELKHVAVDREATVRGMLNLVNHQPTQEDMERIFGAPMSEWEDDTPEEDRDEPFTEQDLIDADKRLFESIAADIREHPIDTATILKRFEEEDKDMADLMAVIDEETEAKRKADEKKKAEEEKKAEAEASAKAKAESDTSDTSATDNTKAAFPDEDTYIDPNGVDFYADTSQDSTADDYKEGMSVREYVTKGHHAESDLLAHFPKGEVDDAVNSGFVLMKKGRYF